MGWRVQYALTLVVDVIVRLVVEAGSVGSRVVGGIGTVHGAAYAAPERVVQASGLTKRHWGRWDCDMKKTFIALIACGSIVAGIAVRPAYSSEVHSDVMTLGRAEKILTVDNSKVIVELMNEIKRGGSQELVYLVHDLWVEREVKYPAVAWNVIRTPRVRIELANVLVQAHNNQMIAIDLGEIRQFVREILAGSHEGAKRTAVLTLGLLNSREYVDEQDITVLRDIAMEENPHTFRAAVIALAKICGAVADQAMSELRSSVKKAEYEDFVQLPITELAPFRSCDKD